MVSSFEMQAMVEQVGQGLVDKAGPFAAEQCWSGVRACSSSVSRSLAMLAMRDSMAATAREAMESIWERCFSSSRTCARAAASSSTSGACSAASWRSCSSSALACCSS